MKECFTTDFDDYLSVASDEDSHRGKTLVTLVVRDGEVCLFPHEARELALLLDRAANMAEGV